MSDNNQHALHHSQATMMAEAAAVSIAPAGPAAVIAAPAAPLADAAADAAAGAVTDAITETGAVEDADAAMDDDGPGLGEQPEEEHAEDDAVVDGLDVD